MSDLIATARERDQLKDALKSSVESEKVLTDAVARLEKQLADEQVRTAVLRDEVNRRRRRMDQTAIMLKDALNLISGRE